MANSRPHKGMFYWRLMPVFGSVLFSLLYVVATLWYPGGTQFNKHTKGFSWTQNYWCNLLSKEAINGQPNPARPIALLAMAILCATLVVFWYIFPLQAGLKKSTTLVMQASGLMSMVICLFIFTTYHDAVINLGGFFGLIAFAGTLFGLKKLKWTKLFGFGLFMLLLVAVNNLLYYNTPLQLYLPVVQKISFLYFLVWISTISFGLHRKAERSLS